MNSLFSSILLSFILIGCSKNGDSGKVVEIPIIQEASISAVVGQAAPIVLDLGNIEFGKSADGLISIKQSLVSSLIPSGLVDGKLVVSGSDELSIILQSGCTSIKKSTGTCSIKVRANTQGLEEGTSISGYIFFHADSETEEETFIQISATVGNAPVVETPALVSSSSSAAFGNLTISDSSKDLILTYKALSLISSSDLHEVVVPSPFVIQAASADRCSNKTISKGASCTVKVRLDPKLISSNGLVSGNITFAGLSIPVSATISGNPEVGQPAQSQLAWIYNGSEISALDLGTLLSSNIPTKFNLYLKNKSSSPEEVNVSFSGTGFTIINRCQNKILAPQAQCSLEVRPEQSVGNKSVAISVADQPSLALPLAMNVINQVITYQTVDTTAECSSLNLQICGGTQSISKSYICEQYIDGVKNSSYVSNQSDCSPLADMISLSCQSPAGQITNPISNGTQQVSCLQGSTAQTPIPDSIVCNSGFTLSNNSCLAIDPSGTIDFANAYSNVLEGNVLNITSQYATQLQLYSNSSCSILSGSPVALPASSSLVQLPSGNGSKIIYAKFLNGSLSSSCLSASIILDQSLPSLAFSAPSAGQSIIGNTFVVSGSCSDIGGSNIQNPIEISIQGIAGTTQTVECSSTSSGTFSLNYTLPTASLTLGQTYNFQAQIKDNAGNLTTNNRNWVYPQQYLLSVNSSMAGATITSNPVGISCNSTSCSSSFSSGSSVTLSQTPPEGYFFAGWSGDCSGVGSCVVTINSNKTVTATYGVSTSLTTTIAGTGMGYVTSNPSGVVCMQGTCNNSFAQNAVIVLTATAQNEATFIGWSGSCSGTGTCSVTLNEAKSVTATFTGRACVEGDALNTGVNLANATGITGFYPNCQVLACNSGYAIINGKMCGSNTNSSVVDISTHTSSGVTLNAISFNNQVLFTDKDGGLKILNPTNNAISTVNLGANFVVHELAISNTNELFILAANSITGTTWKVFKYNISSQSTPIEIVALSGGQSELYYFLKEDNVIGTINGQSFSQKTPRQNIRIAGDARRIFIQKGNLSNGSASIYTYTVPVSGSIVAGGTLTAIDSISSYGRIAPFGNTDGCFIYGISSTSSSNMIIKVIPRADASGCTSHNYTTSTPYDIAKVGRFGNYMVINNNKASFSSGSGSYLVFVDGQNAPVTTTLSPLNVYYVNRSFSLQFPNKTIFSDSFSNGNGTFSELIEYTNALLDVRPTVIPSITDYPNCFPSFLGAATPNVSNTHTLSSVNNTALIVSDLSQFSVGNCPSLGAGSGSLLAYNVQSNTLKIIPRITTSSTTYLQADIASKLSIIAKGKHYYALTPDRTLPLRLFSYNPITNRSDLMSSWAGPVEYPSTTGFASWEMISTDNYIFIYNGSDGLAGFVKIAI